MTESTTRTPKDFYEYLLSFLNEYVELYTYFSLSPLYGEIVEVTPFTIVLDSKFLGTLNSSFNESAKFYLPLSLVISINKL
ncbi:MAG: ATPase [Romboutsia sp.]